MNFLSKLSIVSTEKPCLKISQLGVILRSNMIHAEKSSYSRRVKTFKGAFFPLDVKYIAEAGFFYTGDVDATICFFCGGGVFQWKASDNPWVDHARYFPHCQFVLLTRGEEFICNALLKIKGTEKAKSLPDLRFLLPQKEKNKCRICVNEETTIAFMPCGHTLACGSCASHFKYCPLCNGNILAFFRVYIS